MTSSRGILPQDNLFRAVYALPSASQGAPARAVTQLDTGTGRTLDLQWYVADRWTEIDSAYEGHFMERIAPGAAAKTIRENKANMRILLQHGRDPQIGNKPIASLDELGENDLGGYARGELFPSLDPLVVDGLRAGQYGASFRFGVMRDDLVKKPGPSDYNPKGLPERTVKEMAVREMGPVTWGAYSGASADVRSITDEVHFATLAGMPEKRLLELVRFWHAGGESERIDEGPWDGSESNYTDAQYETACALDRKSCGGEMADATPKTRCSLPYKTPSGAISRAGVHAAAARIDQITDACPGAITTAKERLRSAYSALGENVPDSLKEGRALADRLDSQDFSCLSSMVLAGGNYIAMQDEDDPASNTTTMNQVLALLAGLVQVEIAEAPESDDSPTYLYSAPDSKESRRTDAPVEAPAVKATPTTVGKTYLAPRAKRPKWHLS